VIFAALAIGSVAALAAGCTRPGGGWPRRTTTTQGSTPTTDGHGHTDHDHANLTTTTGRTQTTDGHGHTDDDHANLTTTTMGGHDGGEHGGAGGEGHHIGFDHPPTDAQKTVARDLILKTRAAVTRSKLTSELALQAAGYFTIGDAASGTNHYVKPAFHRDSLNLNPEAVEAFAVRGGRVVAAMYVLDDVARPRPAVQVGQPAGRQLLPPGVRHGRWSGYPDDPPDGADAARVARAEHLRALRRHRHRQHDRLVPRRGRARHRLRLLRPGRFRPGTGDLAK
jgi:hypothetical protein